MTTQKKLRSEFWALHPEFTRRGRTTQNGYHTDIRCAWCDFIEYMRRSGTISDSLADRATL